MRRLDNLRCRTEGEVVGGEVGVQILPGSRSEQRQPVAGMKRIIGTRRVRPRPLKQPHSSALVT